MKTTKAFWLQEVRQSHTARVYGRDTLTLHLVRSEGHERYFGCNLMHRKVLAPSYQHLMAEAPPAARNTLASARIPRASKLLICGLFQKGRVLAQDGMAEDSYQQRDMSLPQLMVDPALKSLAEELGMVELHGKMRL